MIGFNSDTFEEDRNWMKKFEKFSIEIKLSELKICTTFKAGNQNLKNNDDGEKLSLLEITDRKLTEDNIGLNTWIIVWNYNVFKLKNGEEPNLKIDFYISSSDCYDKLKKNPIVIKLDHPSSKLVTQINFSECFCNSVRFQEFFSQTVSEELIFKSENEVARCLMKFTIKKETETHFNASVKKESSLTSLNENEQDDTKKSNISENFEDFCDKFTLAFDLTPNCMKMLQSFNKIKF